MRLRHKLMRRLWQLRRLRHMLRLWLRHRLRHRLRLRHRSRLRLKKGFRPSSWSPGLRAGSNRWAWEPNSWAGLGRESWTQGVEIGAEGTLRSSVVKSPSHQKPLGRDMFYGHLRQFVVKMIRP